MSMIPEGRNIMLNLKSLKNALSCAYNNVFNSPLKKDLFHLANALEQCSEKTGTSIISSVEGKALVYITKDRKMVYVYVESGSGYGFGIDKLKSFNDFTKGFNVYVRRELEKALKQIWWNNKYYTSNDPEHEVDMWLKDC